MTARSLLELLGSSRLFDFREAVRSTLDTLFPEIEVAAHPGKIDIADIVQGDSFHAPSIHVAIAEVRPPEYRVSGLREVSVKVAAYVVVEDQAIGDPPKRYTRDEIGLAVCDAIIAVAENPHLSRWGLDDIAYPEQVEMRPLLTAKVFDKGTAYYVVTFRQQLTGCGDPFWEPLEMPPPILWPSSPFDPPEPEGAP